METYFHSLLRGEKRGPGPTLQRAGLRLLSIPYGWAVRGRNWLYDRGWKKRFQAAVPVISVGNLTVGGTGKTPCVEYLARWLRQQDVRVTILSRGYGSHEGRNDEAQVLEENLPDVPHLQGADRVALAQTAIEELETEVLLLDDGFQHRRLGRDLDIVLIDATCPWGHDYLLPRGLLREPVAGLNRADVAVLTHCDQAPTEVIEGIRRRLRQRAPELPVVETTHRPARWVNASRSEIVLEALAGRQWAAFCGIGNPDSFRRTLTDLGGALIAWRTFPDHHGYARGDVEDLERWASELPDQTAIVTTQKDLVKIRLDRLAGRELWALAIRMNIASGEELLSEKLFSIVRREDAKVGDER